MTKALGPYKISAWHDDYISHEDETLHTHGVNHYQMRLLNAFCPTRLKMPYTTDQPRLDEYAKIDISSIDDNTEYIYSVKFLEEFDDIYVPVLFLSNQTIASMLIISYSYQAWTGFKPNGV